MKSIVKTLIAASLSIAAVSACSEEKLSPSTTGTKTTVHFGATSSIVDGATKATLTTDDETRFIGAWENGDEIKINYYGLDDNLDVVEGDVNGTWNGSSFDASVESSVAQTRGSWEYKAAYPVPDASDNHVDFGSARTQKGNSYNSKYDIMIGKESGIIGEAEFGKDDSGKNVVFNMERQTAIAYFHFTSIIDEAIKSATLSVSGDEAFIASNYAYVSNFAWASTEDYKSITITFPEEAPNAKDFQLWFNVLPTSYDSITLTIETATKTLTINNAKSGKYEAGHLYKAVKTIPDDKWVENVPTYDSLADLIAAGAPTENGSEVTVTLQNEQIVDFYVSGNYTNGVYFNVGGQVIQIYCRNTPAEWKIGGLVSGILTDCVWKLYKGTWELCPNDYTELSYIGPCEDPIITFEGAVASITCSTEGATIYYTVGDSPNDPTELDMVYSSPITLLNGQTIKAIAVKSGMPSSSIVSKQYVEGGIKWLAISSYKDLKSGVYTITAKSDGVYYSVPKTTIAKQTFTCLQSSYSETDGFSPAEGSGVFEFIAVDSVDNAYYLYNTDLKKYLVATGSKKFGYVDNSSSDYGYWTFTDVTSGGVSGAFSVKHSGKTQYMRAYSNSVRCYDGTSNNGVYLFVQE